VGFKEYGLSISFEKDQMKTKLLTSPKIQFPQFLRDEAGFVSILPEPTVKENEDGEKTISLMGYYFPSDAQGKRQLTRLFRASVFHLSAHVLSSNLGDYEEWRKRKNPRLAKFTTSIIEDVKADAYISTQYPDKLIDVAFANTLALKRLHKIDKLVNPATRVMAGLLMRINTGFMKVEPKNERRIITHLAELLCEFKEKAAKSFKGENVKLKDDELRVADEINSMIENTGPITEVPFLPHAEELGVCSIFSRSYFVDSEITLGKDFQKCLEFLGGTFPSSERTEKKGRKTAEAEALQVFDSWKRQREKTQKIIAKYEKLLPSTRFKSVGIPEQDYTEFLRVKSECKSEAHRIISSLLVGRDALDEDPRKMYGVLDLQEVIQVIASKSPRMDVFKLDENLGKSYAWAVVLDASRSMKCIKDLALKFFVMLIESANQLLLDPTSWSAYAFNDRLLVIKDTKEQYNARVKSRIGGIKFDGFTYMPDALEVAGQIIKARTENLRLITIISDGWPYGYPNINVALNETIETLQGGNIVVIGIGAKSHRMESFFNNHCTAYTLRDLTKKFSNLYLKRSRIAVET